MIRIRDCVMDNLYFTNFKIFVSLLWFIFNLILALHYDNKYIKFEVKVQEIL